MELSREALADLRLAGREDFRTLALRISVVASLVKSRACLTARIKCLVESRGHSVFAWSILVDLRTCILVLHVHPNIGRTAPVLPLLAHVRNAGALAETCMQPATQGLDSHRNRITIQVALPTNRIDRSGYRDVEGWDQLLADHL